MTELAYILAALAVLVVGAWLWQRYGKWASIALAVFLALVATLFELRHGRRPQEPVLTKASEKERKALAEALRSGQQRMDDAREDGVAALKAELKQNRLDREG